MTPSAVGMFWHLDCNRARYGKKRIARTRQPICRVLGALDTLMHVLLHPNIATVQGKQHHATKLTSWSDYTVG